MNYKILVSELWQENTVVLYDETGDAAIVDCGCLGQKEEKRLQDLLKVQGLNPVVLLNTHLHPDHIFGNYFMKEVYELSTQAAMEDEFLIENAVDFAAMLGIRGMNPPPPIGNYLKDGDLVQFGNSQLRVIAVQGHSPGGLCFYSEADQLLVAGDVLFAGSIGRSDLPGGNGRVLVEDICQKLMILPEEVKVIPGHGPETTIGYEKRYNPFLGEFINV